MEDIPKKTDTMTATLGCSVLPVEKEKFLKFCEDNKYRPSVLIRYIIMKYISERVV